MKLPESIETSRTLLRKPILADAKKIFESYASNTEVTKYLSWKTHKTVLETHAFITTCLQDWQEGTAFHWVIEEKTSKDLMGMVTVKHQGHKANFGYVLAKKHWGKGYMTEVAKEIVQLLSNEPSIIRIWAFCDTENSASCRVMEKAGLTKEGILKSWIIHPNKSDVPRDCHSFVLIKSNQQGENK